MVCQISEPSTVCELLPMNIWWIRLQDPCWKVGNRLWGSPQGFGSWLRGWKTRFESQEMQRKSRWTLLEFRLIKIFPERNRITRIHTSNSLKKSWGWSFFSLKFFFNWRVSNSSSPWQPSRGFFQGFQGRVVGLHPWQPGGNGPREENHGWDEEI